MKKFYVCLLALVCVVTATVYGASKIKYTTVSGTTPTFVMASNTTRVTQIQVVNPSTSTVMVTVFYTSATSIATLGTVYTKYRLADIVLATNGTETWYGDDSKYYNLGVFVSTGADVSIKDLALNIKYEN